MHGTQTGSVYGTISGGYSQVELYKSTDPHFPKTNRELVRKAINFSQGTGWDSGTLDIPTVLTDSVSRDSFTSSNNQLWAYYGGRPLAPNWWGTGLTIETNIDTALSNVSEKPEWLTQESGSSVSITVTDSVAKQGSKSLYTTDNSSSQAGSVFNTAFDKAYTQAVIGTWMRTSSTSGNQADFYLYDNSLSTLVAVAGIGDTGYFHYWDGSFHNTNVSFSANTWYLIELEFNTDTDKYNFVVYDINNTEIVRVNNISFAVAANGIDLIRVVMTRTSFVGTACVDNYRLRSYSYPEPSASLGNEENEPAPTGSVLINNGDTYTTSNSVTLTISATDNYDSASSIQMQVSNSADFSGASWESYTTSKSWALSSGDGSKTVYVRFKDSNGNISSSYSDDITYDTTAPTASSVGASPTSSGATVSWTTNEDASSQVEYGLTTAYGLTTTETDTSPRVTSHSVTLSNLLACTAYHYRVRSKDAATNETIDSDNSFTTSGTCPTAASSNSSIQGSTTLPQGCNDTPPGAKAPWLYGAIAQDSGSVLLYFTEADEPVSKYVLEYGTKSGDYPWGSTNIGGKGTRTYLEKSLSPNTTYYFRVRAGNGCATGLWSNEISATTRPIFSTNNLDIVSSELNAVNNPTPTPTPKTNKGGTKTNEEIKPTVFNGYDVRVKVVDTNKKPVEGAKVTIHSKVQEALTNKGGIAEFKNIEAGEHRVIIAYKNYEGGQTVNLTGDFKEFDLNVTIQQKAISISPLAYGIIGVMAFIILVLVVLLKKAGKNKA